MNGELIRSSTFAFTDIDWGTAASPNITIGALSNGSNAFTGSLDDVRVYNSELTQSEIIATMGDNGFDNQSVAITVNAINDAPVLDNTGLLSLDSISENETGSSGNTIAEIITSGGGDRITDVDAAALEGIAISSTSGTNGTWQYNTGSGWTNVGSVSVGSSLLLRSTDSLRFVPGESGETATISFSAWDQTSGTAGTKVDTSTFGGTTAFSSDTESAIISVADINDAPSIANFASDFQLASNNGTPVKLDAAATSSLSDADSPDFDGGSVQVVGTGFDALDQLGFDISGNLSLSAGISDGSVVSVSGVSIGTLSSVSHDGFVLGLNANSTLARVELVLQELTFESTATAFGTRSVDVTVNDGDGIANGGSDSATSTLHINLAASANGSVTTNEDTSYTYVATDFDFTGVTGAALRDITISSLPVSGTLELNSTAATAGQTITKAQIDAGQLTFTPDSDSFGTPQASFSFYVNSGNQSLNILTGEPSAYTLNSSNLTATDEILLNESHFGPTGTHPAHLQFESTSTTIDATYLSQGQIYFGGYVNDSNLTAGELTAIESWVNAGGVLISTSDSANNDSIAEHFGLVIGGTASSTWHVADTVNSIINGDFGSVGNVGDPIQAAGTISYFDSASLAVGDLVIATDSVSSEPTMVLRAHGDGWILFTSDEGIFRQGMSGGGVIATPNDILAANVFAWAADATSPDVKTMEVNVAAVNDAPTISATNSTPTWTENGGPVGLFSGTSIDAVEAGDRISVITIGVSGLQDGGDEVLMIDGQAIELTHLNSETTATNGYDVNVTISGSDATLVISKTGGYTSAEAEAMINGAAYNNTSENPQGVARVVTLTSIQDDGGTANGGDDFTSYGLASLVTIQTVNDVPTIANVGGDTLNYTEGDGAQVIDQSTDAAVTDVDSSNFDTGTLTVSFTAGSDSAEDILAIVNTGTGPGQIGVSGSNVTYGGVTIGSFTGGSGGVDLVVTLNANADATAASPLLRAISYENTDTDNPTAGNRTVRFVLTDGDGGTSGNHDATVNVSGTNDVPTIVNLDGDTLNYTEGDGAVVIEQGANAVVTDIDSADFDGGTMTVSFSTGSDSAEDVLAIRDQGTGAGQVGVSGSDVTFGGTVIGSFAGGSGGADLVVTFNANASSVGVTMLLQNITYENTDTDNPTTGARTVEFEATDGDGGTSATHSTTVNVGGDNDAPTITNLGGDTLNYSEGDGQRAIEQAGDAVVADVDSSNFDTGTLTVSFTAGNDIAEDILSVINQGTGAGQIGVSGNSISFGGTSIGSFVGGGGGLDLVITLNANADAAAVSALIQAVSYENADLDNPTTGSRTIRYVLTDGDGGTSAPHDTTINVSGVNDAPVTDANGSDGGGIDYSTSFTEGGSAVGIVDSDATISDVDDVVYNGLGINLAGFVDGNDEQIAVNGIVFQAGVSHVQTTTVGSTVFDVDFDGSGFTITRDGGGTIPQADLEALLLTITYEHTGDDSTVGNRMLDIVAEDDSGLIASPAAVSTIAVSATNDASAITNLAGDTLNYNEGDAQLAIDQSGDASVTDADSANFDTGTLTVSFPAGSDNAEDVLSIFNQGMGAGQIGVSGSNVTYGGTTIGVFVGGSGGANLVITLNSNADDAAVSALVRAITYENTDADNPTTGNRTVRFVLTDGDGGTSADYDTTVNVSGVNDDPTISNLGGDSLSYNEGDGAVVIDQSAGAVVADVDSSSLDTGNLFVSFAAGADIAEDVLAIENQGTGPGQIGVSGSNVTYAGTVIGSFTGGIGGVDLVVTLNANADSAAASALLQAITYENTDTGNPTTGSRTVRYVLTDGDGGTSGNHDTSVTVAALNDDPVNLGSLPSDVVVTEDVSSGIDLSAINLSDVDAGTQLISVFLQTSTGGLLFAGTDADVTVSGSGTTGLLLQGGVVDINTFLNSPTRIQYFHGTPHTNGDNADTLTVIVNDMGNTGIGGGGNINLGSVNVDITAVNDEQVLSINTGATVPEGSSGNAITSAMLETNDVDNADVELIYTLDSIPGNGTLRLSGTALSLGQTFTQADIDAGIVTYDHDGSQAAADSFDFTVDDGIGTTTTATFNFTVTNVNDAPVVSAIEGGVLAYTENDGAVAITSTLAISDVDDTNIESAVIQIAAGFVTGEDLLSFSDQNGISGSWNSTTGEMTLTGTATIANYEAAIRSVSYTNTSENPTTSTRTISFTINDGDVNSNTLTRDISIASVNDDPTNAGGIPSDIAVTEDVSSNVDLSAIDLTDVDHSGGNLTLTLTTSTGGNLAASTGGGVTVGGSGTATLTLTGTQANLNGFLDTSSNVTYLHGATNTFGDNADTIDVVVNDNGNTGSGGGTDQNLGTVNVDITAVNDTPALGNNSLSLLEGETVVLSVANLSATDVDDADSSLIFNVSNVTGGHFALASAPQTLIASFTQAQITASQVVFIQNGSESAPTYDVSVTDSNTSTVATAASVTFTNVNDAPIISSLGGDSTVAINDGLPVSVDATAPATLVDPDAPVDYAGASLLVSSSDFLASDLLGLDTSGSISLSAGISDGSVVSIGGTNVGTLSGTSASSLAISFNSNATAAHVDTLLRSVTFESTSSTLGARTVDFIFNDGDGTANGGVETSPVAKANIVLASANDGLVTTNEDTTYTFAATDFDFTGITGSGLESITVTRLPSNGSLTLNSVAVSLNQVITKADIDAGRLRFDPVANENGAIYASFDFYTNTGKPSVTVLAGEPNSFTVRWRLSRPDRRNHCGRGQLWTRWNILVKHLRYFYQYHHRRGLPCTGASLLRRICTECKLDGGRTHGAGHMGPVRWHLN